MKMKIQHYLFILIIALIGFNILSCSKDEEIVNESPKDEIVQTRNNGVNTKVNTFFLTSGTLSNCMKELPPNRVYRAYNYSLMDSITRIKTSQGNANIYYTNTDYYNAANFNITFHYKNGTIDTLNNVLSKYNGVDVDTYIPSAVNDLIHKNYDVRFIQWTQRSSNTSIVFPYNGATGKIYNWDVHYNYGITQRFMGRNYFLPERPTEYEFALNNKP